MLLEIVKGGTYRRPAPPKHPESWMDQGLPLQISTFEELLVKATCAYPELILLASEISKRVSIPPAKQKASGCSD